MTQSSATITAHGIRKSFGEHTVLDDVDLEVDQGTIFALLGPNGAGKTTIVRILSTLLKADAGRPPSSASTSPRNRRTCESPSASPGSSRPWTRSSPGARTWC